MASGSVLVLSTDRQAGLAIVTSLGQRGVPVVAGGSTEPTLGMLSRYSEGEYVYPDPRRDAGAFVDTLLSYLRTTDHEFVFGPTDQLSYLLSKHKADIEATGTRVAAEDFERFREVYDKAQLFERLSSVPVECPETHAPTSIDDVEALAPTLSYPVVVKPRSKTHWPADSDGYETHKVSDRNYADSPDDLVDTYRTLLAETPALADWPPIVQSYVPGQTTTTVVLADDGEIRAHFQERRLRTVPPSGGSSALLGVVDDETMRRAAARVIEEIGWTGPAQVEFMERPDGTYVLIEMNGRYWGSLPFAINCGVDFPWLHYRQLRGERIQHDGSYRTDVVQRRTSEDFEWLYHKLAAGEYTVLVRFLADFVRADHTFVSTTDPLPTAYVVAQLPRLAADAVLDAVRRTPSQTDSSTSQSDGITEL